jgi:hypothetical protein
MHVYILEPQSKLEGAMCLFSAMQMVEQLCQHLHPLFYLL